MTLLLTAILAALLVWGCCIARPRGPFLALLALVAVVGVLIWIPKVIR